VDETDIARIKLDQRAAITLDAYPDKPILSKVARIAFDAKAVNNVTTYQVDIIPDEVPAFMKSGMTANVAILCMRKENVLWLPSEAIHQEGDRTFVQIPAGKRAESLNPEVDIITGLSDGKKVEVVSGLRDGDTVVLPVWIGVTQEIAAVNPFMPHPPRDKKDTPNGPK